MVQINAWWSSTFLVSRRREAALNAAFRVLHLFHSDILGLLWHVRFMLGDVGAVAHRHAHADLETRLVSLKPENYTHKEYDFAYQCLQGTLGIFHEVRIKVNHSLFE